MEVTFLELQSRDVAGPGKLSGYHQESMAKSGKRKRLPVLGETEPFKPSHKIVSEKGDLGVEGIGLEISCGSATKGEIVFQDPDDPFQASPILGIRGHLGLGDLGLGVRL